VGAVDGDALYFETIPQQHRAQGSPSQWNRQRKPLTDWAETVSFETNR